MDRLALQEVEALDEETARSIDGGNPIALAIAYSGAAAAGFQWGYTVLGPYLVQRFGDY